MKISIPFLMSVFLMTGTLAQAQGYRQQGAASHDNPQSKEGLSILITANNFASGMVGDSQTDTAEQIQVTVYGSNLRFGSQVRAVLTPNCVSEQYGWGVSESTLTADLTSETDGSSLNYTTTVAGALVLSTAIHGGEDINCTPELSIVVDGVWQTDPVNGSHNFKLTNF